MYFFINLSSPVADLCSVGQRYYWDLVSFLHLCGPHSQARFPHDSKDSHEHPRFYLWR